MSLHYIGSGDYCYANATAMALAATGASYDPGYLECLCTVAVSAFREAGSGLYFFSSYFGAPDQGVSAALDALGYAYVYHSRPDVDPAADGPAALEQLRSLLAHGPVVVGPVDMSRLLYLPHRQYLEGVDHYVAVYGVTETEVLLHDPKGFPYVSLPIPAFLHAWRAETIGYRTGSYSMWGDLRRAGAPDAAAIFRATDARLASILRRERAAEQPATVGVGAIRALAEQVRGGHLPTDLHGHLGVFALAVGARRCSDYARFFEPFDPARAELKVRQGRCFGRAQYALMQREWAEAAAALLEWAELEDDFQRRTLAGLPRALSAASAPAQTSGSRPRSGGPALPAAAPRPW